MDVDTGGVIRYETPDASGNWDLDAILDKGEGAGQGPGTLKVKSVIHSSREKASTW